MLHPSYFKIYVKYLTEGLVFFNMATPYLSLMYRNYNRKASLTVWCSYVYINNKSVWNRLFFWHQQLYKKNLLLFKTVGIVLGVKKNSFTIFTFLFDQHNICNLLYWLSVNVRYLQMAYSPSHSHAVLEILPPTHTVYWV